MARKQTLAEWILEAMTDSDKDGQCTALSLVHLRVADAGVIGETEVHTIKFKGDVVFKAEDLAETFSHKANGYSQELTGVQQFCLYAFYGERKTPEARHPFKTSGELNFGGMSTEAPNETGVRSQQMRLTEAIVQGAFRQSSIAFDNLFRTSELQALQNQKVMQQNAELMELTKTLLLERETKQHEHRILEHKEEQKTLLMEKGANLLPALLNTVTGKEIVPAAHQDTAILEAIASSITEDQAIKLAQAIPEEVRGVLAGRLQEILTKREKNKETRRKLVRVVKPEYDEKPKEKEPKESA